VLNDLPLAQEPWRCGGCKRLLGKLLPVPGQVLEIKCGSCNSFNHLWIVGPSMLGPVTAAEQPRALESP